MDVPDDMKVGDLNVRVAPAALDAYRRLIDRSLDERGAHVHIAHLVQDYVATKRGKSPPRMAPDGAEIWRVGADRVILHAHVHAAVIDVVHVAPPHAKWRPVSAEQAAARASPRSHTNLGLAMRHQRERVGHSLGVLAELAGVSVETVQRLERGDGIPDEALRALGAALDVDVLVRRRLR